MRSPSRRAVPISYAPSAAFLNFLTKRQRDDSVRRSHTHTVTIAKYDGKDNPVQGSQPPGQTRSYKLIDGGYENVLKLDGKVATTGRFLLSRDGKTLTQTVTGKDVQGRTVNHSIIWERQ